MIRNKPDSYCYSWDVGTEGVSAMIRDLLALHAAVNPSLRPTWPTAAPERRRRWGTRRPRL